MAFKDKFKSIFLAEMEEKAETLSPSKPNPQPVSTPTVAVSANGEVNQKMVDGLCEALDEKNLEGPDYLEIKQASEALKTVLPDPTQRFQAAFASMKANFPKFTKQVVLDSIDTYIQVLESERQQGKLSLNGKRKKEINDKEQLISNSTAEITEMQMQIERLKKQIEEVNTKIQTKQTAISATESQINNAKISLDKQENDFDKSVDYVINQLTTDKNLLNSILS
jgi:chromosome segregation ATPase